MRSIFCLLFLLVVFQIGFAQSKYSSNNRSAIKSYERASYLLDLNNFKEAITELNIAIEQDDQFIEAYMLLADVYRVTFDYPKAKETYKNAYTLNPTFAPERYYYYAECELKTGDYQSSLLHYRLFKEKGKPSAEKIALADKYIKDCLFSIEAIKHPVPFKPENLGANINTSDQEYLAVLTSDESTLIFTRQINRNEDFYRSFKVNGEWSKAEYLSANINTPSYNEGAQCISPDGQYLFFTGCNRPDGLGRCDIYISKKEGNGWSKPVNLGFPINTKGWESQPSISSDGKTLYFVSDRNGGFGSYDIWKSTIGEDGKWQMPENLGPNINTPFDEQSPFIHPDNKTLYFSSNGWVGLGNKDLYISRLDSTGIWSKPENLGYPINTYGEESGLTINANGTKAFFSSDNYNGFGGFDIYSFDLPKNIRPNAVNYVKGVVYDEDSKIKLQALIDIRDLKTGKSIHLSYSDEIDGSFLATIPKGNEYSLNASREGYLFFSENFSLDKYKPGKPFILEAPLQKIAVGKKVILKNIFFDSNKFDLKQESISELQKIIDFLEVNPKIHIEISGYTDDIGNDQSNLILSQNRAKAVYQYLTSHDIDKTRLNYRGYGETKPVSDNKTVEGRANNRRTEFLITKVD
ncbi:MAG: OmpA family protein [Bacteroidetes bacterium]|nr:OmpA family protein [Bacteroidota bacterium]MBU1485089.1 OmpA family protein [Bacteroidota bacterium]MBU2046781.1 OmpA family protein [Bacteroidota bacterium]MBU2267950.1 OmpA family protein [Bacteroidota bacterium]MBU2376454.1 OmpA family protein [Bacteroidota bacterium]